MHGAAGQFEPDAQPAVFRQDNRFDGHRRRFVIRIELLLHSARVDELPEIAFLIEKTDADDGNVKVAGRLEKVSGQDAQSAGIKRQGRAQTEFHAEIGNTVQFRGIFCTAEPAGGLQITFPLGDKSRQLVLEFLVGSQQFKAFRRSAL